MSGQIKVDDLFRNIGPDAAGQLRGQQRFLLWAAEAAPPERGRNRYYKRIAENFWRAGNSTSKTNLLTAKKRALNEDDLEHLNNKSAHTHENYCDE